MQASKVSGAVPLVIAVGICSILLCVIDLRLTNVRLGCFLMVQPSDTVFVEYVDIAFEGNYCDGRG